MQRLDRIGPKHGRNTEDAIRTICRRCDCNAVYDVRKEQAFFYVGEDMQWGICACPIGGSWDNARVDAQVRFILTSRKPEAMKDRELAMAEQEREDRRQREMAKIEDDRRPELIADTKRAMERRQMGRHYKGRASVQGSKK